MLDGVLTDEEVEVLTSIARDGTMIAGGGAGGASIIELHTSSASAGENFISLFNRAKQGHEETINGMEEIYSEYRLVLREMSGKSKKLHYVEKMAKKLELAKMA